MPAHLRETFFLLYLFEMFTISVYFSNENSWESSGESQ